MAVKEIVESTNETRDGRRSLRVGKVGRTTGLTWGQTNDIASMVREKPGNDGEEITCLAWGIVSRVDGKTFGAPGDSGSAIFDFQGRVCGMLTMVLESAYKRKFDIVYAVPMDIVMEDIKKHRGGEAYIL